MHRNLCKDLSDLRLETHIQHAICLIKHQFGHPPEIELVPLEEVVNAARGPDHAMHTTSKLLGLRAFRGTSIATDSLDHWLAEFVCLLLNLNRQLASRSENAKEWSRRSASATLKDGGEGRKQK